MSVLFIICIVELTTITVIISGVSIFRIFTVYLVMCSNNFWPMASSPDNSKTVSSAAGVVEWAKTP